jgi:NTP pyrophosphatase (non-canonical NTP hydrolase)
MELNALVALQAQFDSQRATGFPWDEQASAANLLPLMRSSLGLAGEAGEVAELVKKADRGDLSYEDFIPALGTELADVLAYTFKLAHAAGIDIEQVFLAKIAENERRFPQTSGRVENSATLTRAFDAAWLKRQDPETIAGQVGDAVSTAAVSLSQLLRLESVYLQAKVVSRSNAQEQLAGVILANASRDIFVDAPEATQMNRALLSAANDFGFDAAEIGRLAGVWPQYQQVLEELATGAG